MELLYCPFGAANTFKNPFNPDFALTSLEKALKSEANGTEPGHKKKKDVIVRGVLSVTVISAEGLPQVDLIGKADPYVVLIMKKSETKFKTRVRLYPCLLPFISSSIRKLFILTLYFSS